MDIPESPLPYPDAEVAVLDALGEPLSRCNPVPEAVSWIPRDYDDQLSKVPLVVVQRIGTAGSVAGQVDGAIVEVGVLASTRATAWRLLGWLRAWMLTDDAKRAFTTHRLIQVEEFSGPVMPAWVNPDHRYAKTNFRVSLRLDRSR